MHPGRGRRLPALRCSQRCPAVRLILDAANEPPDRARARPARRCARRLAGHAHAVALEPAQRRRRAARRSSRTTRCSGTAVVGRPDGVGRSARRRPAPGSARSAYAMRHVGHVGRPVGGSGCVPAALRAAFEAAGGTVRTGAHGSPRSCATATRSRGVAPRRRHRDHRAGRRVGCDPHDTFLEWLREPAAAAPRRWSSGGAATDAEDGYESKIDAVLTAAAGAARSATARSLGIDADASRRRSPRSTAATHDDAARHGARPAGAAASTCRSCSTRRWRRRRRHHVLQPRGAATRRTRLPGGWAGSTEPQRWLELFAGAVRARLPRVDRRLAGDDPRRLRARVPPPAGHATSFAGGPLAALRDHDPELTRYETPVNGLYLTGAATFPGAGVWGASGRNARARHCCVAVNPSAAIADARGTGRAVRIARGVVSGAVGRHPRVTPLTGRSIAHSDASARSA